MALKIILQVLSQQHDEKSEKHIGHRKCICWTWTRLV